MAAAAPGETLHLGVVDASYEGIAELIASEVEFLNEDFALGADLAINLDSCGEANAFYDPETAEITLCTEYVDYLAEIAP
jgi:hypothetical protein